MDQEHEAWRPFAGQRADIPVPRERTPSPVRRVGRTPTPPAPARDFDLDPAVIDVIYAEDEEMFREVAVCLLEKSGFQRKNIHQTGNGLGALELLAKLQVKGHCEMPLLVLLDVRMPSMDGRECALQIQELVKKHSLRREPFVVCISSSHKQVLVDEGMGNFQVVLPKPFNDTYLKETLDFMSRWWSVGHGRCLPAWKHFDPSELDVITADEESIFRMAAATAFIQEGVAADSVCEVDAVADLLDALTKALDGDKSRPLVVLLGAPAWAEQIRALVERRRESQTGREPFVVSISVEGKRVGASPAAAHFHAFLPSPLLQTDVKWCLEFCRLWWQTRGDGPADTSSSEDVRSDGGGDSSPKPAAAD